MCGIFGYSGDQSAATIVHEGLKRLEYRGYDSWGIVVGQNKELIRNRSVGKLPSLDDVIDLPQSHTGIGHTRWATHGGVTENNAHPHLSSDGRFALAHNGIVENYLELKQHLTNKGTSFKTETDTEVILHLFENNLIKNKSILAALEQTVNELEGRNTCIILDVQTDDIYAFKNGSPLLLGKDETGNAYFSSDSYSLSRWANTHYVVDNQQLIHFDQKKRQFIVKDKLTNESTTPDFSLFIFENTTAHI